MESLGECSEQRDFVFCRRLMHFQSLKYLRFWNKSLGKDACPWWSLANMFQRWSETTEFGVMRLVLCDCFFPTTGPKSLLQCVLQVLDCFWEELTLQESVSTLGKKKKISVCWWWDLVQEGRDNGIFQIYPLCGFLICPEIRLQSLL